MDFYVDIAVAVILRLTKDKRERGKYIAALRKVYNAIGSSLNPDHVQWEDSSLGGK